LTGRKKRPWQDTDYVLGYFGRRLPESRKDYLSYVEEGLGQGRRDELTGGGLIRSLGGWSEVKRLREEGGDHIMSDERILGESEFVETVLSEANESYERRYKLKRLGYDLDRIAERVAKVLGMEKEVVFSKGRQRQKVEARSLLCFWAVVEAGFSLRDLARRLGMSGPGVGYAMERERLIAQANAYELIE